MYTPFFGIPGFFMVLMQFFKFTHLVLFLKTLSTTFQLFSHHTLGEVANTLTVRTGTVIIQNSGNNILDHQDGSMNIKLLLPSLMSLDFWDPLGRRQEVTPASCSLTSACAQLYMHILAFTHKKGKKGKEGRNRGKKEGRSFKN